MINKYKFPNGVEGLNSRVGFVYNVLAVSSPLSVLKHVESSHSFTTNWWKFWPKTLMNSEDRKTPVSLDLRDVNVGA